MTVGKVIPFLLIASSLFYILRLSSPLVTLAAFPVWLFLILLLTSFLVPYFDRILNRLRQPIDPKGKAVLITGCDHGFGYETALGLNKRGFHVFAGCLEPEGPGAMRLKRVAPYPEKLDVIQLDVTNEHHIQLAQKFACDRLHQSGLSLWGLLNNAGIYVPSCLEFGRFEEEHATMFHVNLFGVLKVTRAFLPLIRQSQGRIVTMSSLASRQYYPFCGTYSMTKSSIRSFIQYLRHEMAPFNVKVIAIEPSFARTAITQSSRTISLFQKSWAHTNEKVKSAYGTDTLKRASFALQYNTSSVMQVDSILDETLKAISDAFTCHEPDIHYAIIPFHFKLILFFKQLFPESFAYKIEKFILDHMLNQSNKSK